MRALRFIFLSIFVFLAPTTAFAGEESRLTGAEITERLSGNTVFGNQRGAAWKQFFDSDGNTTYVQEGSRPSAGKWEVRGDDFCSLWPPSPRWDCYIMTGAGEKVTWIPHGDGPPWPATLKPGNQLNE